MNNNKKQIIVTVLLLANNVVLGFLWNKIPQYPSLAFVALSSGLLWVFFILFAKNTYISYIISGASILFLASEVVQNVWTVFGLIFGIIIVLHAFITAKNAHDTNVKFSIKTITGQSLRIYFTGIAVFFSFSYLGIIVNSENVSSILLPKEVFDIGMRVAEKPLQKIVPGIAENNTVDDALALFIHAQLQQSAGLQTSLVPSLAHIKQTIPKERKEIIRALNKELGINIDINTSGTEKLSTVLYHASTNKIDEFSKQFSSYVPWILAIGFFFSLKTISWLYYYIIIIIATIVIKILLSFGIVKIETIPVEKEILK